ncbi:MAG: hypothetical protein IJ138_07970 [Clostridia bacterium]|nr:hypothetical protein [Clostridia bacterium]
METIKKDTNVSEKESTNAEVRAILKKLESIEKNTAISTGHLREIRSFTTFCLILMLLSLLASLVLFLRGCTTGSIF